MKRVTQVTADAAMTVATVCIVAPALLIMAIWLCIAAAVDKIELMAAYGGDLEARERNRLKG